MLLRLVILLMFGLISMFGITVSTSDTIALAQIPTATVTAFDAGSGLIVYTSYDEKKDIEEIYVMDNNGKNPQRLTNNKARDITPVWSPDGKYIAFATNRDDANPDQCNGCCNFEIYVMDANGENQHNLTDNKACDLDPTWSPDGKYIAFSSDRIGNEEIYVMDIDGKNQHNLTNNKANDSVPAWSPNGKYIAFSSDRDNVKSNAVYKNWEIYIINPNGSHPQRLTNNEDIVDYNPAWSPDSKKVAYEFVGYGTAEIYVMDSNGDNQTNLTNSETYEFEPAFSPDGKNILFQYSGSIYIMDINGNNRRNLAGTETHNSSPDWQPITPYSATQNN